MEEEIWLADGEIAEIHYQLMRQVRAAQKLIDLLQTENMDGLDVLFKNLFDNVEVSADKLEIIMTRMRKQAMSRKGRAEHESGRD